jgi:ribonuclease G
LRDLGGIIILDFIDMEENNHRQRVLQVLKEAIKSDRAKINILPLSPLGLVQMTRQRVRSSLESIYYEQCPYCQGRGSVKSITTMSIETQRILRQHLKQKKPKQVAVKVNPLVAQRLSSVDKNLMLQLEREFHAKILIQEDSALEIDDIRLE